MIHHSEAEFDKFGIASDGTHELSFLGSVNETKRGWLENQESCDVYKSWEPGDVRRIRNHKNDFEEMWNTDRVNTEMGLAIFSFPEAAKEKMLHHFPPAIPGNMMKTKIKKRRTYMARGQGISAKIKKKVVESKKWSHQKDAIDWFLDESKANGRGILQMATGAGKTRTAIGIMRKSVQSDIVNKTIVCVPKTLEEQWDRNA